MVTQVNPFALKSSRFEEKELEILHMVSYEYEREEIAHESGIPANEIDRIIESLYEKLDVNSRHGLVRAAFETGLLQVY